MAKSGKCECNWFMMILGVVVMAVGLWLVVKAFFMQGQPSSDMWMTMIYYAIGILVLCVGKIFKHKGCCGMCAGYVK